MPMTLMTGKWKRLCHTDDESRFLLQQFFCVSEKEKEIPDRYTAHILKGDGDRGDVQTQRSSAGERGRQLALMHAEVVMIRYVLLLLLLSNIRMTDGRRCDWASRGLLLMVAFHPIIIVALKTITIRRDWWSHISIDHMAIWLLLRCTG